MKKDMSNGSDSADLMTTVKGKKQGRMVALRITIISLLICGLFFPLLVTVVAQISMPYQANGELVSADGRLVGSNLIAQPFTSPAFFHPRNDSASGVDPDITIQDAYLQAVRIHNVTGIPMKQLEDLINRNVPWDSWISGQPYVNVLHLNIELVRSYPMIYQAYP